MTSSRDRQPLEIRINPDLSQPELLTGLEAWLNLGLIDQEQVKQLAKSRLTCQIPEPVVTQPVKLPANPEPAARTEEKVEHFLSRTWNAFREELSVRWLLFLGVFAVLVASGGLAASQWDNFSAIAQYAVLWAYTLAFGGVGAWIARQHRSRLTAGALQTITALLVPINFWAMDALIPWNRPLGWLMIALAATTLTGWLLLQRYQPVPVAVVFLGASYLHWGWDIANWPTVAVYLGAIASTALIVFFSGKQNSQREFALSEASLTVYALVILLGRAIIVVGIPLIALDLAIAICGWLLTINRETQESVVSKGMEMMGGSFLLLAWGLALGESFPWQAVVATALALEWVWRRLRRFWQYWDLIAVFGIGLQGWGLLSQFIAPATRSQLISFLERGLGLETAPFWILPSLGLFPYLVIFLGVVDWLYQIEKPQLGHVGEGCSLGLGAILTVAGLEYPSTRSLALLMMTVMLILVTSRRSPTRIGFVYVTHLVAWLAIASSLDWMVPNLAFRDWGILALVAMVGEWAVSTRTGSAVTRPSPRQVMYRSGWHFGFLFTSLSFVLLANQSAGTLWGGLWLIAPITLTVMTNHWVQQRQKTAAGWAITASLVAQGLTMTSFSTRLLGWSVATGLLALNTRYFPKPAVAMLPVGSALALAASPFWNQLRVPGWLIWGAIALILLWLATDVLSRRRQRYPLVYARATNNWGILVCIGLLTVMTGHGIEAMLQDASGILPNWESSWQYSVAASLSTIALVTRYWREPRQVTGYGLILAIELTALETVDLAGGSQLALAMVNLGLGVLALFASYYRFPSRQLTTSLQIAPFCFAIVGVIARLGNFTAYTGLLTLAAAVIGLFVGSRRREWKAISYIALLGIFLAIQELVIYQFSPVSSAVSVTDLNSVFATVSLALALAYRVLTQILARQERETMLGLSVGELAITAHLHWGTAVILAAIATFPGLATSPTMTLIAILNSIILATYAVIQGRDRAVKSNWWVYVGLVQLVGIAVSTRLIWTELAILDPWIAMMACLVGLTMLQLPWQRWGWNANPWYRVANALPAVRVLVTADEIAWFNLFIVAGFYGRVAWRQQNIRWSYGSVALLAWGTARLLDRFQLTDSFWYAALVGLSILYIASVDPALRPRSRRNIRHWLRLFGSGIISFVGVFSHPDIVLAPTVIGLLLVFAGIALQVRAFLFVGTATLLLTGIKEVIAFSQAYSFAKWIIGLVVGIVLIAIAASFESRRERMISTFQNWSSRFREWE